MPAARGDTRGGLWLYGGRYMPRASNQADGPFVAFAQRDFRLFQSGRFLSTVATLAFRPLYTRAGGVMLGCVALFGIATIAFGLSRNFGVSLCALGLAGAADMVSVLVRHTWVLLNTPDDMRGRVAAVSHVFIDGAGH